MPAGGSSIAGTVAHKHQSASATGGPLDANSITEFSSTTTGSLVYFDGSSQATNLNAGNLNDVLTMGASVPAWSAAAGGGVTQTLSSQDVGVEYSTASTTYIDIFFSQVLQAGSGHALCQSNWYCSTTGGILYGRWSFSTDGDQPPAAVHYDAANDFVSFSSVTATLGAQTCKTQWKSSSGTIYLMVNGNSYTWEIS